MTTPSASDPAAAALLAQWLAVDSAASAEARDRAWEAARAGLEDDVVEAVLALRPDLAPAPRFDLDAVLDAVTTGPLCGPVADDELGPVSAEEAAAAAALARILDGGGPGARELDADIDADLDLDLGADLDDEVREALHALRPDLAPAPRFDLDAVLDAVTTGPLAPAAGSAAPSTAELSAARPEDLAPVVSLADRAAPAAPAPVSPWRWMLGPGVGLVAMAATVLLFVGPVADEAMQGAPTASAPAALDEGAEAARPARKARRAAKPLAKSRPVADDTAAPVTRSLSRRAPSRARSPAPDAEPAPASTGRASGSAAPSTDPISQLQSLGYLDDRAEGGARDGAAAPAKRKTAQAAPAGGAAREAKAEAPPQDAPPPAPEAEPEAATVELAEDRPSLGLIGAEGTTAGGYGWAPEADAAPREDQAAAGPPTTATRQAAPPAPKTTAADRDDRRQDREDADAFGLAERSADDAVADELADAGDMAAPEDVAEEEAPAAAAEPAPTEELAETVVVEKERARPARSTSSRGRPRSAPAAPAAAPPPPPARPREVLASQWPQLAPTWSAAEAALARGDRATHAALLRPLTAHPDDDVAVDAALRIAQAALDGGDAAAARAALATVAGRSPGPVLRARQSVLRRAIAAQEASPPLLDAVEAPVTNTTEYE